MKKEHIKRVAIITGASSGIGKATAQLMAKNGYTVYGIARKDFNLENVKTMLGDITKKDDMDSIVKHIIEIEGQIDILINNAGFGISGSVEFSNTQDIRAIFEANFIGAVSLVQLVLPYMRAQDSGKIINTSSVASFIPIPFQAFYSATKSALDTWAMALRMELKPFNIKVCNVLPGDIKTEFTSRRVKSKMDVDGIYSTVEEKSLARMEHDEQNGMSPTSVAKVMLKMAKAKNPPPTKTVGFAYKTIAFLSKVLPKRLMLWVVGKMYG